MLYAVLWINAAMFLAESIGGFMAHSTTLAADSVDMLGDAIVYGFSLYVIHRRTAWHARAAVLKGIIMAASDRVLVQMAREDRSRSHPDR